MRKKRLAFLIIILLVIAFIFGQSFLDQKTSRKESDKVLETVVRPVYEAITGKSELPYDIRDFAHIIEFSVLGFVLAVLLRDEKFFSGLMRAVSYCGLLALIDESIQYLSGRSPEVVDIWLDILGAVVGAAAAAVFLLLSKGWKRKKRQ